MKLIKRNMSAQNEKFKTQLSEDELNYFKEKLMEEKQETKEEIERLKESADLIDTDADDRQSGTHHHFADVSSENEMKDTTYSLLEKQRDKLNLINEALDRIDLDTYGICVVTGKPIKKERLEAIPYARHSVEASK